MCEATLALSIVMGAANAASAAAQQSAQHANAVSQVRYKNAVAKQNYENKLLIAKRDDEQKVKQFEASMEGVAAEKEAYRQQTEINALEQQRASEAAQFERNNKIEEAAFKGQTALVDAIKAQGTMLASGQQAGQSMLLELGDIERQLGFKAAEIDQGLFNTEKQWQMKEYEIGLAHYTADKKAQSQIKGGPMFKPLDTIFPTMPIMQSEPSKPSSLVPILGGISAGFQTYTGTSGLRD